MAEVLDFTAATRGSALGAAVRPVRPVVPSVRALRPRAAGAAGGMPVIAPMPATRPGRMTTPLEGAVDGAREGGAVEGLRDGAVRDAAVRDGAEDAVAEGTTVDHLTETYRAHYRSLLGLAALLLDDTASCEDVVQEAFIRVHSARKRVRDPQKTLAYLRQTVVNLSRSALRRRILGLKLLSKPMPDMASAEEGAYDQLERDSLIKAMKGLQRRQREVLVLRYFADMTEAQVAETLGISLGSVKAYGSRGIAALRVVMGAQA
ncbi:SigE family RNA polymerase sigma factor [Streptomyces sp. NPDC048182]|uniref:SigE family RNA polymerase sigma factor n=1 Tax=Streptomyces sp. NPDC048182 TaxID=3365507 RepID=UPI003720A78E